MYYYAYDIFGMRNTRVLFLIHSAHLASGIRGTKHQSALFSVTFSLYVRESVSSFFCPRVARVAYSIKKKKYTD